MLFAIVPARPKRYVFNRPLNALRDKLLATLWRCINRYLLNYSWNYNLRSIQ